MKKLKILITGANSDVGCPLAHSLSQRGHHLYLHYHHNAKMLNPFKSESVILHQADLTHDEECENLVRLRAKAKKKFKVTTDSGVPPSKNRTLHLTIIRARADMRSV